MLGVTAWAVRRAWAARGGAYSTCPPGGRPLYTCCYLPVAFQHQTLTLWPVVTKLLEKLHTGVCLLQRIPVRLADRNEK